MRWFLGLVFMGNCNRLPVLNQDVIHNQPGGGGGGGGGGFNKNCYGAWRIGSFIAFLGFTRKNREWTMEEGRPFLVLEIGDILNIL